MKGQEADTEFATNMAYKNDKIKNNKRPQGTGPARNWKHEVLQCHLLAVSWHCMLAGFSEMQ